MPTIGVRPFRFEAAWLTHCNFAKFTEDNWEKGRPLHEATKIFTGKLILWNKEIFGNIKRKERLRKRLEGVQRILAQQPIKGLLKLEDKLKVLWDEVLAQEEILKIKSSKW